MTLAETASLRVHSKIQKFNIPSKYNSEPGQAHVFSPEAKSSVSCPRLTSLMAPQDLLRVTCLTRGAVFLEWNRHQKIS